jgi:hypothetical protein
VKKRKINSVGVTSDHEKIDLDVKKFHSMRRG